ncbi:MAG: hypothetical protein ACI8QC_000223 [Planctomycetota bacterium]|jgi:hypothetical protein
MSALRFRFTSLLAAAGLLASSAAAQVIYVDAGQNAGLNDGSSWADALQGIDGLKNAIGLSVAGDQIFVAEGTYRPSDTGTRGNSFRLNNDVEIYGGFVGGETAPDQRPAFGMAPSILTGDLNGDDGMGQLGDNSYHVLRAPGSNASAIIDGFRVEGGNANGSGSSQDRGGGILVINGSSVTVRNCHFIGNRCTFGGGAGYVNGSPSFIDVVFEDNIGGAFGGAFDIANSGAVVFDRCSFYGNRANRAGALEFFSTNGARVTNSVFQGNVSTGSGGGGAFWVGSNSNPQIRNCTIVDNSCTNNPVGGILVSGASPSIINCILWNNAGGGGAQNPANQVTQSANVTYSLVQGGMAGTGNIGTNPGFEDQAGGDFNLTLASFAVDAGNNSGVPAGIVVDVNLEDRFVDELSVPDTGNGSAPVVDMGAYEFQGGIGTGDPGCMPLANSTGISSTLTAGGSLTIADNNLSLMVSGLPLNQFGYFLMSESTASNPVGSGVICLGSQIYRFNGNILNSGFSGLMNLSPDLSNLPQGQVFMPGSTWYFQLWHRDGATSNFSSSLGFTWQ